MIDTKVLKKLSKIYVLIVEDDELTAHALHQSLSLYCNVVNVAYDGMSGFEMFEKRRPDVVISDINLPEMNGLEMVEAIHEISPHVPIIIMTSYDSVDNITESIKQGAYSYLRKPIRIEELQTALLMATKEIYNVDVVLENGFSYNRQSKRLSNIHGAKVSLTKTEKALFDLLISNIDKIIDYVIIETHVWQEKSMSIAGLRKCIKEIRKKTYAEIIENISKCGYRINSTK